MAKDKELQDHERAHNGQPGSRVKHGADALKRPGKARLPVGDPMNDMKDMGNPDFVDISGKR